MGIAEKLCWGRAVGVYLGEGRITFTEIGATLRGLTVLAQHEVQIGKSGPREALKQLLEEHLTRRQRRRTPVCLGVGAEHTFFATCQAHYEQGQTPSLEDLLTASGAGNAWGPEQMAGDHFRLNKVKSMGSQFWSVAACRRELVTELLSVMQDTDVENFQLQPGPWSLTDAANRQARRSKFWKVAVRVLLHGNGGLAILVVEDHAVLWRRFTFVPEQEAQAISSGVRSVLVHAIVSLGIPTVGGVVLQGEKAEELAGEVADNIGIEVVAAEGEGFTDTLCSYGLALSAKQREQKDFDLFRGLRPSPSIRDIFPWKLAIFMLIVAACMGLAMWDKSSGLADNYNHLKQQNTSHKWAVGRNTRAIKKERKTLAAEVGAVSKFVSTRTIWSDYLADLPTRLPPNACLSNIWATCEMKEMAKKKRKRRTKKSLTLRGMTRFANRGAAPKEIDAFLESLRKVELLQRDFPRVQLAEIKWRRDGKSEIAIFTVVALPKSKKGK